MLMSARVRHLALVLFCSFFASWAQASVAIGSDLLRTRWNKEADSLTSEQIPDLERQAQAGDFHAVYLLYYQLGRPQTGFSQRPSASQVASWLRPHVERNQPLAVRSLSYCYRVGACGVEKNEALSLELLRKSADLGFAHAQYLLGLEYEHGSVLAKDSVFAEKWVRSAIENGSTDAMHYKANKYLTQVPKNSEKAIELYLKAADLGDAEAFNRLGELYRDGTGVTRNDATAVSWFRKGADVGGSNAILNLGWMHQEGRGVEKNQSTARQLYERSAAAGNMHAVRQLGWCYFNGTCTEKNDVKAFNAFKTAAEGGDKSAANTLGWMYERGRGTAVDTDKALKWYEDAASSGISSAMFNLGIFYRDGLGSLQDDEEALKWFQRASDAGDLSGKNALAQFHEDGRAGPAASEKVALELYRQTAGQGSAYGMYRLGVMLDQGRGLAKPNKDEATKWLDQAAKNGQQRNVANYRKQAKLDAFRLALVQARKQVSSILELPKTTDAGVQPTGAPTTAQLLERVVAAKTLSGMCASGLASRNVCEGTYLTNLLKRYSQENLIQYSQLKGSYSILIGDVIQAVSTLDKGKATPAVHGDKAILTLDISNGKIKSALSSPEFRESWVASAGQSLGMMAFSMLGGNDFDAAGPGALLGNEIGDILIALIKKYGAGSRACMDLASAAVPHRLRDLEMPKSASPYTSADDCVDQFLERNSAAIYHDLLKSVLPLAEAVMDVYGPQLFPERDRLDVVSILSKAKNADLRKVVSYVRTAKSAEFNFDGLRRELQLANQGMSGELIRFLELINSYLYRTPQFARLGVFVFAGIDNFRLGKDSGIWDADQYLQSLMRAASSMQAKEISARVTLRRQVVAMGSNPPNQQTWLVDDITFPSFEAGQ